MQPGQSQRIISFATGKFQYDGVLVAKYGVPLVRSFCVKVQGIGKGIKFLKFDRFIFAHPSCKKRQTLGNLLCIFAAVILTPQLLIQAYLSGAFPMAHPEHDNSILWHTPAMRGIIPLDERFVVPRNLARKYRNGQHEFYINRSFDEVIRACAGQRSDDTWISEEIIEAYIGLNRLGYAHSFETWENGQLAGGLYGVSIGKAFFGESMFFYQRDASKLALVFLVEFLREHGFRLLDTQYLNPHLLQFGATEVTHDQYLELLQDAIQLPG